MMGGFGLMGAGGLLWIVLLGLVVWAVVAATRQIGSKASTGSARATLDERLARGELSIDEYRKLRNALE